MNYMQSAAQRVLIVDDDPLVAETLQLIFKKNGFDVRLANSAEKGLKCARKFFPDLLLCDLVMPGCHGLSLVRDVAQEFPSCRIIVLTGFYADLSSVEKHSRKLPRRMGILTKPCLPKDLLREAHAMLAMA